MCEVLALMMGIGCNENNKQKIAKNSKPMMVTTAQILLEL